MVLKVKDPAFSLQQLGSLLWCGFDPWPRNIHLSKNWQKKKRNKEKKNNHFNIPLGFWCFFQAYLELHSSIKNISRSSRRGAVVNESD